MLSHSRIKFLRSLQIKKFRDQSSFFIVEGEKMVTEALQSIQSDQFEVEEVLGLKDWLEPFMKTSTGNNPIYTSVTSKELEQISSQKNPNKAIALIKKNQVDHCASVEPNEFVLAFDHLQDPGNLGTIIRLADWYQVDRIVLSQHSVDPLNQKVIQASMGSIFRIPIQETKLEEWIETVSDQIPVYAATLKGKSVYQQLLKPKGVLVLGNESSGIRQEIINQIKHPISIPRRSPNDQGPESLNVAMATAIFLSEFTRNSF